MRRTFMMRQHNQTRLAGLATACAFVALFGLIATHVTVYPVQEPRGGSRAAPASVPPAMDDPFTEFQRGRFDKALSGFDRLIAEGRDDYRVRYFRGLTEEIFHDDDRALTDMLAAVKDNPDFLQGYDHADRLYTHRHQWRKIVALWDLYLARHPHDSDAYLEQASALGHAGDMPASRVALDKACQYGDDVACAILYSLT